MKKIYYLYTEELLLGVGFLLLGLLATVVMWSATMLLDAFNGATSQPQATTQDVHFHVEDAKKLGISGQ